VSYFGRNTFAACITDMVESGLFEKGFDSYISTAFLVCYGCGQFINGRLTGKFSPKLYAAMGLFGSGLSNILMAVIKNQYLYILFWAVNGFCCSMLWPTIIRIFTEWLNDSERPSATANISPSIPVGSIICYLVCSLMLNVSWELVFIVSGSMLCIGATVWAVSMKLNGRAIDEKAEETAMLSSASIPSGSIQKTKLSFAFFFATGLGVMAVLSILSGTLKEAVINWIPTYLTDSFGYSTSVSALISTLMPLAGVLGPYFAIWINNKIDNEATTIAILMGISAVCNGVILLSRSSVAIAAIAMLAVSTACMWGINTMLMTFTCYHFKNHGLSSAVTGTLNALVYVGSSSFTYLYRSVNEAAGSWLPVVGLWTALGTAAAVFGLLSAGIWKRKRPNI